MGFLDEPSVKELASIAFGAIEEAQSRADVRCTPVAREVIALFLVAPAFEPSPDMTPSTEGTSITTELCSQLPTFFLKFRDDHALESRSEAWRNVISTADVYHWIAEQGEFDLAGFHLPYPKD